MARVAEVVAEAPSLSIRVEAGDLQPPRRGAHRGGEDAAQRRLARAVFAQHRDMLAGVDHQVHAVEGVVASEPMREPVGDDDAHRASPSPFMARSSTQARGGTRPAS